MGKKRMLYVMGIDWKWIYQRPQILAKKLAQDYDVTVMFPRSIATLDFNLPNESGMNFLILWTIPFQEKNPILYIISLILNALTIKKVGIYDYIYIGYPLYARYIPDHYDGGIIYDCMDNYEAIYPDRKRAYRVVKQEHKLAARCDVLLVTSEKLRKKMDGIVGAPKSILVRNGADIKNIGKVKKPQIKNRYSLGYIGTISDWFDHELIKSSMSQFPDSISYHFIGSNQIEKINNVSYYGSVPHDSLYGIVCDFDCLIMPFIINDIVAAVDPVKLYEYIAFGKCIISVYYPEIERFRDYVYFYKTQEEYIDLLKNMMQIGFMPKYSEEQQKEFLLENTWDSRYKKIRAEMIK